MLGTSRHRRACLLTAAFRHPGSCSEVKQIQGRLGKLYPAQVMQHTVRAASIAEAAGMAAQLLPDVVLVHGHCTIEGKVLMEDDAGKVRSRFLKRRLIGKLAGLERVPQLVYFNGNFTAEDHAAAGPKMTLVGMQTPVNAALQAAFLLVFLAALLRGVPYQASFREALADLPAVCAPILLCGEAVAPETDGLTFIRR